ncbi:hypothetical protein ABPG77_011261 [Micractinium sp. CCAP 211/92]
MVRTTWNLDRAEVWSTDGCGADNTCQLLGSNCTLSPTVESRSSPGATAGFPLREPPLQLPGYATRVAQGVQGGDLSCAGSVLPHGCAFSSALNAAAVCAYLSDCRSVVVYQNGTDGCSDELAALKRTVATPANSFVAPSVYVLETTENAALPSIYLTAEEGRILPPSPEAAAEAEAAAPGHNFTEDRNWLGCIVADHALMAGAVVGVLDGVPSAEACCQLSRARADSNVWNWCPTGSGACGYRDMRNVVALQEGQCELRWQQLAVPEMGWPPATLAKGHGVAFSGGAALAVAAPDVEGFTSMLGSGLWGQPGFDCPGTLKPELQECVLSGPLPELAANCLQDTDCSAFVFKPAGLYMSPSDVAYFRHPEGANISRLVRTPTGVLYIRNSVGSSSQLPAGAIAGIACGVAAVAVAAAAAGWVLVRRRRRLRGAVEPCVKKELYAEFGQRTGSCAGGSDSPTCGSSGGSPPSLPGHTTSSFAATQAGLSSRDTTGRLSFAESGTSGHSPPATAFATHGAATPGGASASAAQPGTASGQLPWLPAPQPGPQVPLSAQSQYTQAKHVALSPFAIASRRASLQSPPSEWLLPQLAEAPGSPEVPALPASEPDRELLEVIRQRAERAVATHLGSACTGSTPGATTASRGAAEPSGTSSPTDVTAFNLPPSLRGLVVPPDAFEYERLPSGELVVLGEGASGRVLRARFNGEVVAAKEFPLERGIEVQESFRTEATRLQQLRHPHIVSLYAVSLLGGRGVLLMEYCSGHDLFSVLPLVAGPSGRRLFNWHRHGCRVAFEVATALNYLHSRGVVHMDVKSHNVLLTTRGVAKLADVGVSRILQRTFLSQLQPVGTFAWVAPEVLMAGTNCNSAVDLFSFGVLLHEIITGERPVRGQLRMPSVPDEAPQEAVDLMLQCMSLEPAERPTALQAMQRLAAMQQLQQQRPKLRELAAPPTA